MSKRTWVIGLLIAAAVSGAWLLRPGMRSMGNAVALHVETDCDSAQRACRARGDDLELELRLGPPVRPMETFDIQLRRVRGVLAPGAQVDVQFQMRAMDMGLNRYRLLTAADGIWHGRAMLPVCSTGRSDWLARVEIVQNGRRWTAELPFEVE